MNCPRPTIHFMLGSHMDLYWMAPPRDCLDRGCDIINRALGLCQQYEDYRFYIETTVFAEYYLSRFPEKKALLQKLISENRLEIGACYVDRYEHMHGGESIVRHYIYGKHFLAEHLGTDFRGACHSDLPGLSPQIPQICALSQIDYYIRARGPLGLYNWLAPDGSSTLYASVGYTYGRVTSERLKREMDQAPADGQGQSPGEFLMRGGYGDLEMPDEHILHDIHEFCTEFPGTKFAISSPSQVLGKYVQNKKSLPTLSGEWPVGWASIAAANVQAFQKIFRLENDLLTLEKLAVLGGLFGEDLADAPLEADWWTILGRFKGDAGPVKIAPGQELYEAWKAVLFVQDHNYAGFGGPKSELDRDIVLQHAGALVQDLTVRAARRLFDKIHIPEEICGQKVLFALPVFNPLAWHRDATVFIRDKGFQALGDIRMVDAHGREASSAKEGDALSLHTASLPPLGYRVYYGVAAQHCNARKGVETRRANGQIILENAFLRVAVDIASGTVESLFDKLKDRELAENSAGARFAELVSYEESGVDVVYGFTGGRAREENARVSLHHADAFSSSILVETTLLGSRVTKTLTLEKDSAALGLQIEMYWWGMKDQQVRLCLPFSKTGYHCTRYGVPYYAMTWPDMMQGINDDVVLGVGAFNPDEIDACSRKHIRDVEKWLDVGYEGSGVTLTTSTTSVFIDGSRIEPLLLRTGVSCGDPNVWVLNQGRQCWDYTIRPHAQEETAERSGWEAAAPPLMRLCMPQDGVISGDEKSFFAVTGAKVVVTSVKPAYSSARDVIVRFYETDGSGGEVTVTCPLLVEDCWQVDLLEQKMSAAAHTGRVVHVPVRPYEIKTLHIRFKEEEKP